MATYHTGNFKHLTLSDRANIEIMIEKGFSFSQMARALSKDSSTISKEIRRHRFLVPHYHDEKSRRRSECAHFSTCTRQHLYGRTSCSSLCSKCRSKRYSPMPLFLRERDYRASVRYIWGFPYTSLRPARYSRFFSVILTNNGFSFKKHSVFGRKMIVVLILSFFTVIR